MLHCNISNIHKINNLCINLLSLFSIVAMPVYTSEISQPEVRKITGVFAVICISFGGAFSMIFGKVNAFTARCCYLNSTITLFRCFISMEDCSWFSGCSFNCLLHHSFHYCSWISCLVNIKVINWPMPIMTNSENSQMADFKTTKTPLFINRPICFPFYEWKLQWIRPRFVGNV